MDDWAQISGFDVGHWDGYKEVGEDRSKNLPMELFFLQNFLVMAINLYLNKPSHLLNHNL